VLIEFILDLEKSSQHWKHVVITVPLFPLYAKMNEPNIYLASGLGFQFIG
jgi:hypothetical protein